MAAAPTAMLGVAERHTSADTAAWISGRRR
jgi:hypothetical protein